MVAFCKLNTHSSILKIPESVRCWKTQLNSYRMEETEFTRTHNWFVPSCLRLVPLTDRQSIRSRLYKLTITFLLQMFPHCLHQFLQISMSCTGQLFVILLQHLKRFHNCTSGTKISYRMELIRLTVYIHIMTQCILEKITVFHILGVSH